MEPADLKYDQIEAIAAVLRDSPRLTEIEVRNPETGVSLRLRRAPARAASAATPAVATTISNVLTAPSAPTSGASVAPGPELGSATKRLLVPPSPSVSPKAAVATAGLVGVFRPVESRPIAVGDTVNAGQVLGYIESMRLMNECSAPINGAVSALLVADGQPVEYGQPLFEVLPTAATANSDAGEELL